MLRRLTVENVAVIEHAEIEFLPGFNVLTGETGAGKSIVIDALGAVIGERAGRELVRTGAENASVSGVFDVSAEIFAWLDGNGINTDEDDAELIIVRKINADGKSNCRVNGASVSVAQLRELGELLADIHGQNDGRALLAETAHLSYLDAYAKNTDIFTAYSEKYKAYKTAQSALSDLKNKAADREIRIEELSRQIDEISAAKLIPGEEEELLQRRELLKNSGKLTGSLESAYDALRGGGDALGLVQTASALLEKASALAPELNSVAVILETAAGEIEEAAELTRDFCGKLDFSPQEQDKIEERLSLLRRIERRYGTVEETLLRLGRSRVELEELESWSENITALERDVKSALRELQTAAAELTKSRKSAASELENRVAEELAQLSMPGARFVVNFDFCSEPAAKGTEDIKFLMSANAGEEPGRISKIASGGELSRIMLALKSVLPSGSSAQIFDEIDAGVSGIAAGRVAAKLKNVAAGKQVLCVTHLPQIAAVADAQFLIEKQQRDGRTFTEITPLDRSGRVLELARLIGGENVSDTTLLAAEEMLN
jgi:DNA repair protein RecN (Recombination protein N)